MGSLSDHLAGASLDDLAIPSNIAYGTAIHARGAVQIIAEHDGEVEAWAGGLEGTTREGGGGRRRVRLWVDAGLRWHCVGNPRDHDIFCKHCVAVYLYLTESGPRGGVAAGEGVTG